MADRLAELLRQRALLQEHLAWLDSEIDRTAEPAPKAGSMAATPPLTASSTPPSVTAVSRLSPGAVTHEAAPPAQAEEIFAQYQAAPDSLKTDVRKGCLIYFAVAFGLLIAGIAILTLIFRSG